MSKKKETKEERSERRRKELRLALRVFRYFLPYKWAMVVALLASAVVSGTTAGTAWLIKPALDDIFIRQDGTALLYVPLAFIVLTALKGAGRYLQNWCMHYSALHVLETMRQELFQKIKDYLERYEQTYRRKLTQKQFVIGLIEQTLEEAEDDFAAYQAEEGGEAAETPETEDTPAGEGESTWVGETGGFEAHSEELEESTENEDNPYYA